MKVKYVGGVKPGDTLMIAGWLILWDLLNGSEEFGGVFPTHHEAEDYARCQARGRSWRLVPCDGHSTLHQVLVGSDGTITVELGHAY